MSIKKTLVVSSFLAFGAFAASPVLAQTPSDPNAAPITGDKMPTAGQMPAKPAKADRKAERKAAREARRPEAAEAAKNQDYSGGTYNPAGKPKPKAAAKPASAN
jgi:hypothetical protein